MKPLSVVASKLPPERPECQAERREGARMKPGTRTRFGGSATPRSGGGGGHLLLLPSPTDDSALDPPHERHELLGHLRQEARVGLFEHLANAVERGVGQRGRRAEQEGARGERPQGRREERARLLDEPCPPLLPRVDA